MAQMLETPPRAAALTVQNLVDSLSRSGKAKQARPEINGELMALRVSLFLQAPHLHLVFATVCCAVVGSGSGVKWRARAWCEPFHLEDDADLMLSIFLATSSGKICHIQTEPLTRIT